MILPGNYRSSR